MGKFIRNAQGPQIYSTPTRYIDMSSVPLQKISKKENFDQGLACVEGRKTAIKPCGPTYIQCQHGILYKRECENGTVFNPSTSTCTDRTKVLRC